MPDDLPKIAAALGIPEEPQKRMIRLAVMHHGGAEASRLIEGLESQILNCKKEIGGLRSQLGDLAKVLRDHGIRLPESCNDL